MADHDDPPAIGVFPTDRRITKSKMPCERVWLRLSLRGHDPETGPTAVASKAQPQPHGPDRLGGSLALPGKCGSAGASPIQGQERLGGSLALPGKCGSAGASPIQGQERLGGSLALPGKCGSAGALPTQGQERLGGSLALPGKAKRPRRGY
jgi:hypothetical protein